MSGWVACLVAALWFTAACGTDTAIIGVSPNGDTIQFQVIDTTVSGIPTAVSALTLEVGESVEIIVNVFNPLATPVPSGQVTWASADPTTAAVTAGVITGVAEGSTTVFATALGVTASMPVNVTAAQTTQPPPTPGALRQNMPTGAGWTVVSDYGLDDAPPPATAYYENQPLGDWQIQFWGNPAADVRRSQDPTAPASPDYVLEEVYPPGLSGTSVSSWYRNIPPSNKWYISWVVKWDVDFEHNTTSEKLIHFNLGGANYFLFQYHWNDESIWNIESATPFYSGDISLYANLSPHGVYQQNGRPIANPVNGQWIEYELYFDSTTGEVKWWRDGVLHAHHTGRTFGQLEHLTMGTTWGGGGNKNGTHSRYTDHITVAVSN